MANVVWSSGGSTDGNVAGNWNPARVPTTGDTAYYDATSVVNCTFSGNISCDGLNATAAYSGDIDFGDSKTHTWGASNFTLAHTGATDLGTSTTHNAASCNWTTVLASGAWTRGTSTVVFTGTCTINTDVTNDFYNLTVASGISTVSTNSTETFGTVTLSGILSIDLGKNFYCDGVATIVINDDGKITGSGDVTVYPGAGEGITTFHTGGIFDPNSLIVVRPNATAIFRPGNYATTFKVRANSAANVTLALDAAGVYQFNSLELETISTGSLTLDNTNGPASITVIGDLTIDENAGGAVTIDDSGQSVDWDIRGDILDERAGDTFTWTKGTGTVDLSGTADQAVDFMGQDCGQLTITKAVSGTVDIEAGACELGAVTMVDDLTFTNSAITSSADAKSITGDVDFTDTGNDINLGAATWNINTGTWATVGAGAWTRGTSTVSFVGTCTINTGTTNDFYNLTVVSGTTTVSVNSTQSWSICTINGTLSIDTGKTLFITSSNIVIGDGGRLTGSGTGKIHFYTPNSAQGVTAFHVNGTWDIPVVWIRQPHAAAVLASGNYQSIIKLYSTSSLADYALTLTAAGDYIFNSFELETTGTNALALNNTNAPASITITGDLTIDENAGGAVTIDDSGQSVDWDIRGDILDERTGDTFTWTKGTGDITLSGSANQDIDFMGQTVEDIIINKSAGTVTFSGAVTTDSFTGTSTGTGDIDPNGQTITITGNCSWAAAFDFNAGATTMNGCTWIVGGNFTADGQTLAATAAWYLQVTGTAVASGTGSVEYSDAEDGTDTEIQAFNWTDGGNNLNWNFQGIGNMLLGGWGLQEEDEPYIVLRPVNNVRIII